MEKVVNHRNQIAPSTIIIGNGDIVSKKLGQDLTKQYGFEGIMIGRGVFHNPYIFNESVNYQSFSMKEKIALLNRHLDLFEKTWESTKSYPPLKRFFKIYITGFDGASSLREQLMETKNIQEARIVLLQAKI